MLTIQSTKAIKNIHTIQYYALDVYAQDILLPGQGCLGDVSSETFVDNTARGIYLPCG